MLDADMINRKRGTLIRLHRKVSRKEDLATEKQL